MGRPHRPLKRQEGERRAGWTAGPCRSEAGAGLRRIEGFFRLWDRCGNTQLAWRLQLRSARPIMPPTWAAAQRSDADDLVPVVIVRLHCWGSFAEVNSSLRIAIPHPVTRSTGEAIAKGAENHTV